MASRAKRTRGGRPSRTLIGEMPDVAQVGAVQGMPQCPAPASAAIWNHVRQDALDYLFGALSLQLRRDYE